MSDDNVGLNRFIVSQCEAAYRWVKDATDGLTEEQLYYQPSPDTNSIAWLIWHLSRWRDRVSAIVAGEPQVWVSDSWYQRFNIDSGRTGLGDTPEQVMPGADEPPQPDFTAGPRQFPSATPVAGFPP